MHVDIILQLKAPYDADPENALSLLAQTALDLFGVGGNPTADRIQGYLGYVNTPVENGYVRVRIEDEFATALEQIGETAVARFIRAERPEDMPEGGWPPIAWEVPIRDLEGHPTGQTYIQTLGTFLQQKKGRTV